MRIQEIMTKNPACITTNASVREAAELMLREEVGLVPVISADDNRLVGVLTDRDIVVRCVAEGRDGSCKVSDVMSGSGLATCHQTDDVGSLMDAMRTEKVRRIPIVDERGGLVGIVSQADIVLKTRDVRGAEKTIEQISEPGGRHAS